MTIDKAAALGSLRGLVARLEGAPNISETDAAAMRNMAVALGYHLKASIIYQSYVEGNYGNAIATARAVVRYEDEKLNLPPRGGLWK